MKALEDLHIHLEGSVNYNTLLSLAKKNNISLNTDIRLGNIKIPSPKEFSIPNNFTDFISYYLKISECINDAEDILIIIKNYLDSAKEQNITHSEMYFSPSTFLALGKNINELFIGLRESADLAKTYNHNIEFIFDIVRNAPGDGFETLRLANLARTMKVPVTSIGIAGDERYGSFKTYVQAVNLAREEGYQILAHAGETLGPESIWQALEYINPARIGHGISCIYDNKLLKELKKSQIPIEVCPWSNIYLCNLKKEDHPLRQMIKEGLNIKICSDDPGIFNKNLKENVEFLREI